MSRWVKPSTSRPAWNGLAEATEVVERVIAVARAGSPLNIARASHCASASSTGFDRGEHRRSPVEIVAGDVVLREAVASGVAGANPTESLSGDESAPTGCRAPRGC